MIKKVRAKDKLAEIHRKNIAYFFRAQRAMVMKLIGKRTLSPPTGKTRELEDLPWNLTQDEWDRLWENVANRTTPELQKIIASAEADALHAGANNFKLAITGPDPSKKPRTTFNLANPRAVAWFQRNGGSVDYIKGIQSTTSSQIKTIIQDALDTGQAYNKTAKQISEAFDGMSRDRAQRIAVYETGNAYEAGNRQFADSIKADGIEMEKMWKTSDNDRCDICGGNEAEEWIPIDQAHQSGHQEPCAHVNCVISGTLCKSPGGFVVGYRGLCHTPTWTFTTARGSRITVTPNHMFLTDSGFVPAHLLSKGDYIINCSEFERVISDRPNNNNSIPTVDEIFSALQVAPGMTTRTMPTTSEDLHGDGGIIDGNIDIVFPNSLLLSTGKSAIGKPSGTDPLDPASPGLCDLILDRALLEIFKRLSTAAHSIVGGSGDPTPFLFRSLSHPQIHGIASTPWNNIGLEKFSINSHAGSTEDLRDLLEGCSGIVQADQIVGVDVVEYHGYVYDFQTLSGLCIYNSIITSNCRCYEVYRQKGGSEG